MSQSYFQILERFRTSGVILNIRNILMFFALLIIFAMMKTISVQSLMIVSIVGTLLAFFVGDLYINRSATNNELEDKYGHFSELFSLIKESGWLIAYLIFANFFSSACLLILNILGTHEEVACYGVANKYFSIMMLFLSSLQTVLRVKTCKPQFVTDSEYRKNFIRSWTRKASILSGAIAAVACLASSFLFPIINGTEYNNAIPIFQVLMIAMALGYTFSVNTIMMISIGKQKFLFGLAFICCVLSGVTCGLLYPLLGAVAAAVSVVVSNAVLNITNYFILMKR